MPAEENWYVSSQTWRSYRFVDEKIPTVENFAEEWDLNWNTHTLCFPLVGKLILGWAASEIFIVVVSIAFSCLRFHVVDLWSTRGTSGCRTGMVKSALLRSTPPSDIPSCSLLYALFTASLYQSIWSCSLEIMWYPSLIVVCKQTAFGSSFVL
jgi:hypothetical protein